MKVDRETYYYYMGLIETIHIITADPKVIAIVGDIYEKNDS